MGKGDKRSRRGKIFAGSYGKTRPRPKKGAYVPSNEPSEATPAGERVRKPKIRKKKVEEEEAA
jgi:30S ribosomal protein S31